MKLLYFDCFNGASGDMILGALLDAGLPLEDLRRALGSLGIGEYELAAERVLRAGVSATKFQLIERAGEDASAGTEVPAPHSHAHRHEHTHSHAHDHSHGVAHAHAATEVPAPHSHAHQDEHTHSHSHSHRSLAEILGLIEHSALPLAGRARARQLFERLAEAEAAIHQMPVERVHLHEVGALDSIIDIVGAVFAIEWFGAERIVVSPLNVGAGMVRSAHGLFPVPAPATVRLLGRRAHLLERRPGRAPDAHRRVAADGSRGRVRARAADARAARRLWRRNPRASWHAERACACSWGRRTEEPTTEQIVVLECEIDDMNPQIFGVLMDRLYEAGALEVYYSAVQMKKNRPGTLITVLAAPDRREALAGIVFRESTTIGVRYHEVHRERLDREVVAVETPFGAVRCKIARRAGDLVNASPEFDDCVRVATERGVPVKDVHAAAAARVAEQIVSLPPEPCSCRTCLSS